MSLPTVSIGGLEVSRVIIGGNPFSGFSHQSPRRDDEMRHYYTAERIKEELRRAWEVGVTTNLARADHHIIRVMMEHWDEGGRTRWIAQTCPSLGTAASCARQAIRFGAAACYVHGGQMDFMLANDRTDDARQAVEIVREAGLPAGVAGHNPKVFDWAEENLDVDFYMCSYYNPDDRSSHAAHVHGGPERYDPADRDAMTARIAGLSRPVIHYKVFAAGRNDPREALAFVAEHLRPQDAVCVGICSQDHPDMLAEDVALLDEALRAVGKKL